MKLLLDTSVLIDYVGKKQPFFSAAEKVVAAGYFGDAKLWVSTQSLKDAYYVLSNYVDQLRVQRAIRRALDVVTPVALPAQDSVRALFLEWSDYEDCLIALCAVGAKADYIIPRDEAVFARSPVPAITPEKWLAYMEAKHGLEYDTLDW